MKKFEIFFEIYGKKLKTTIEANSEEKAKEIVKNKIRFDKITELKSNDDDIVDRMMGMFGMKK
jgi:hypothetical protein